MRFLTLTFPGRRPARPLALQRLEGAPRLESGGPPASAAERSAHGVKHRGFTLLELLTAMAVLVILVLIAMRLFVQSSITWGAASRRAQVNMVGRAVANYVAQQYADSDSPTGVVIQSVAPAPAPTVTLTPPGAPVVVTVTLTVPEDVQQNRANIHVWSSGSPSGNINSWD